MSRLLVAVLVGISSILFSGSSLAQTEGGAEQLRQFVRNSKTAEGDFVQQQLRAPKAGESQDKGLKVVRQTQGHFVFQRPGRFIWETQKPYEQKLIADGKQLILWDKDLNQATFRPAGQALASTPAAILFGETSLDQHFDLIEGDERLGMKWVSLVPKKEPGAKNQNDLPYTKISIGMVSGLPKALELTDGLGSVVLVTLDKIQLNVNLPANRFTFTPPAGAEVLRLN
ncbi:outer membrane lipoprotein carrier protein LolA [Polynucleobacter sp. MWH-Braz-FAM2G]|uniref:outer membrane lipoprotein carrier protein LolA n=1 Tax=Polynucleobacter sp. MWH-Braz-FAM2G TaxID=1855883 RepID=UPI001BFDE04C|nr:outer membrane lipoprotein carrier protein LolA [Polynucleobacter sp. MWH-Braz-FAM2G]QWD90091.1 outer membrane lipoprotein carrier protein LolA [Polynucleobacter sp. MWH-Braz-FAM2G]